MQGFTQGMSLRFIGKHKARNRKDWCYWKGDPANSVAFADWHARRVRVPASAALAAEKWTEALTGGGEQGRTVKRRWQAQGEAAADAFASGHWAALGGWWMERRKLDKSRCKWFRLEVCKDDLKDWVDICGELQDDIAFFECLAQVVLLALRTQNGDCRGGWLNQGCDNQTSVDALRKRLSTCDPLAAAVQAVAGWESVHDVEVGRGVLYVKLHVAMCVFGRSMSITCLVTRMEQRTSCRGEDQKVRMGSRCVTRLEL